MVLHGDLTFDSRVQREANALVEAGHSITLFCLAGSHETATMLDPRVDLRVIPAGGRPGRKNEPSPFLARSGPGRFAARLRWLSAYFRNLRTWGRRLRRGATAYQVWHAHDFTGLMAASIAKSPDSALVYDVHDLLLESGTGARLPWPLRWLLGRYERRLARNADLVVTVNAGLAAYLQRQLPTRPMVVVRNCVPLWSPPEPRPTHIRDAIGIDPAESVILYHGLLDVDRGLETLYESMLVPALGRAHLVLLGFGQHRDRLRSRAVEPQFGGRIHILDPVPPGDLLAWVASADVGVMPNQPSSLNERLSTPNKLFESIAAGLPVVSSDFPERRAIILTDPLGPLGAVCDPTDPAVLAQTIASIIDLDAASRDDLRARCAAAARERWNWESESRSLVEAYQRMADTALRRASGESVV
jgi:glycosyltransferase involved in cell wall biosynthesis